MIKSFLKDSEVLTSEGWMKVQDIKNVAVLLAQYSNDHKIVFLPPLGVDKEYGAIKASKISQKGKEVISLPDSCEFVCAIKDKSGTKIGYDHPNFFQFGTSIKLINSGLGYTARKSITDYELSQIVFGDYSWVNIGTMSARMAMSFIERLDSTEKKGKFEVLVKNKENADILESIFTLTGYSFKVDSSKKGYKIIWNKTDNFISTNNFEVEAFDYSDEVTKIVINNYGIVSRINGRTLIV